MACKVRNERWLEIYRDECRNWLSIIRDNPRILLLYRYYSSSITLRLTIIRFLLGWKIIDHFVTMKLLFKIVSNQLLSRLWIFVHKNICACEKNIKLCLIQFKRLMKNVRLSDFFNYKIFIKIWFCEVIMKNTKKSKLEKKSYLARKYNRIAKIRSFVSSIEKREWEKSSLKKLKFTSHGWNESKNYPIIRIIL